MLLAIDIGGTKTLLAVFGNEQKPLNTFVFPTPAKYTEFLSQLHKHIGHLPGKDALTICAVAAPGRIDREHGIVLNLGNLPWEHVPIKADIEKFLHVPVLIENDAKLAGLAEAQYIKNEYRKVLYITISTGIGIGLVVDGRIEESLQDSEGGRMMLEHDGTVKKWEDFASGRAIVKKYGKRASEIDDPSTWKIIASDIAVGIIDLIAVLQPEVIVIGGGVGAHFNKFGHLLNESLKQFSDPLVPIPPVLAAKHAEEAVIYGCYVYAKQHKHRA